ncbi:MAG: methyltransferase domain-containing protein [Armatimonadota bacterium]
MVDLKKFENLNKNKEYLDSYVDALRVFGAFKNAQKLKRKSRSFIPKSKDICILDAACGFGLETAQLCNLRNVKKVYGVDISKDFIKYAKKNYGNPKIKYEIGDINDLKFKNNIFDFTREERVLLYLEDAGKVIKELKRVTKKGGILSFIEPDLKYRGLNLSPKSLVRKVIDYDSEYKIKNSRIGPELNGLLKENNLTILHKEKAVIDFTDLNLSYDYNLTLIENAYAGKAITGAERNSLKKELKQRFKNKTLKADVLYYLYVAKK